MPNYDFKTLSPIDFEILARDLLQEEFGFRLESFTSGPDTGIDFRYTRNRTNSLIVQCKHYAGSPFAVLRSDIIRNELPKIKSLNPHRYVLVTSVKLTPGNKKDLETILSPFIKNTSDILGSDDLNNLLAKFPKIERHTFKLWLTSVNVLEEVLHGNVKNVSRDALSRIVTHAKYYVQNVSFTESLDILDKYNFCIIAGIPGIGKTTLAEMLCLHYVNLGYELIYISGDVSEATAIDYSHQRRIFYYDDFLGQTSLSEKLNKNEDQKLLDFINTISTSKVSKLILTTREYILRQAQSIYEKLSIANLYPETYIVDLKKYTRLNRAHILYNHLFLSDLPDEKKKALLESRNYLKIIDHRNYNPRIVDLMTQSKRIESMAAKDYFAIFISNLDNPLQIWRHAFEEQLSDSSRHLLLVMATLPEEVFLEDLQDAFESFHLRQASNHRLKTSPGDFIRSIKETEGNFLKITPSRDKRVLGFHNPSIKDYLREYISSNENILRQLVLATIYYDQIVIFWGLNVEQAKSNKYIFKNISKDLLDMVARSITYRTCRLVNRRELGGEIHKVLWSRSFEEQSMLIVGVVDEKNRVLTNLSIVQVVEIIEQRIINRQCRKDDLIAFLNEYKKGAGRLEELPAMFMAAATKYYTSDIDSLEDVEMFLDFEDMFPQYVGGETVEEIKKEFTELAEQDPSYIPENPDYYRDDANKIEIIAKRFDVDMSHRAKALEERARKLEEEQPQEENDYDYSSDDYEHIVSDSEIDSFFLTLLV